MRTVETPSAVGTGWRRTLSKLYNDFLQGPGFPAQVLDLVAGRRTRGIPGQPSLAGFQKLLRPVVIQALGDALSPTQLRDAVLATKSVQHDADLLFRRILLARGPPNVLHDPLGRRLLALGFLSHLHSLMVTMSQKSSLLQHANSVSQVLIPDKRAADGGRLALPPGHKTSATCCQRTVDLPENCG